MTYDAFITDLNKNYYDLWNIGLKKKANSSLKKYLQKFNDSVDEDTRFNIWYEFCENYCSDIDISSSRYSDSRDISYEISKNVIDYLNKFSHSMPQIKWLYILTNDRDVLNQAFNHPNCDQEVIEYKFLDYINTLSWGAHHASEGVAIITDELIQSTISNCLSMIDKYNIPTRFHNAFHYYVRLYELLKLYEKTDKKNFYDFCKDNDFPFNEIGTFYYTK